jgi:hypothetical protein
VKLLVNRISHIMTLAALLAATAALSPSARANGTSLSFTGTLASPENTFDVTLNLTSGSTVTLQTYGFGGGMNQAGTVISPGGTDPFLAIFSGTGSSAPILTDGSMNPYGTSLDLTNYANPNFGGCPPAGAPVIGGSAQCGDITMTIPLAAGTYTVVLSDGQYIANAVFDNGTLGEGFSDFTGGAFCNININGAACPDPLGGAYALDITGLPATTVTPEPGTFVLYASGLILMGYLIRKRQMFQPH